MALVPLLLLTPILLAVAWMDFRYMRIPNYLVYGALALFVLTTPLIGVDASLYRLFSALLAFAILTAAFCLGLMAGGDVKILAALALFIPPETYVLFGFAFSASLLIGVAFILLLRRTPVIAGRRPCIIVDGSPVSSGPGCGSPRPGAAPRPAGRA